MKQSNLTKMVCMCVLSICYALSASIASVCAASLTDTAPALSHFTETDRGRAQYIDALQRRHKRHPLIRSGDELDRVQGILSDLSSRLSLNTTPTLLLLDAKQWNAYALPGNIILLTTALASDLNDAELCVLLLHELGHIALDHPYSALHRSKAAIKSLDKSATLLMANQSASSADAFVSAIYKGRVERSDEIAADAWAAAHLEAAGRTVDDAVFFLRHAQQKLGDPPRSVLHPSFDERIHIFKDR